MRGKATVLAPYGAVLVLASLAVAVGLVTTSQVRRGPGNAPGSLPVLCTSLRTSPEALAANDIAAVNLACAEGLPGAENVDVKQVLEELDAMAAQVRMETKRHLYRFQRNPGEFENSESFFRMVMLAVVLAEDYGVHYAPGKRGTAAQARMGDGFFADARDVFLHGLTGQRRAGTCSSLPVLYVAVGRRLGYPLKLVTTKGHLFVRWEDDRERFNVEATGRGVNRFPDEYYLHWPLEVSEQETRDEGYLKSLTPPQELAVFLSIRGMCLREAGEMREAAQSFREAARFAPECAGYQRMLANLEAHSSSSASALAPVLSEASSPERRTEQ